MCVYCRIFLLCIVIIFPYALITFIRDSLSNLKRIIASFYYQEWYYNCIFVTLFPYYIYVEDCKTTFAMKWCDITPYRAINQSSDMTTNTLTVYVCKYIYIYLYYSYHSRKARERHDIVSWFIHTMLGTIFTVPIVSTGQDKVTYSTIVETTRLSRVLFL